MECLNCKKTIESKNAKKFCGSSCAATYNNKRYPKRKRSRRYTCKFCGGKIHGSGKKYCSMDCAGDDRKICKLPDAKTDSVRKRIVIEQDGHVCRICSRKTWNSKPIPLVLDHIDGDSSNNDSSNLRVVCGNCDMQLPTYKSKNRGNGRHQRRERYKQGKSY